MRDSAVDPVATSSVNRNRWYVDSNIHISLKSSITKKNFRTKGLTDPIQIIIKLTRKTFSMIYYEG